jgi:hypothetical protein
MKKIIPSLLIGLALGTAATWLVLHRHEEPAAAPDAKPAAPSITTATAASTEQRTLGTPVAATINPEVKGYGRVLDPAPLLALAGEAAVATIAAEATTREFQRVKLLHDNGDNATLQAVETAEAGMHRDEALRVAARARLDTAWGHPLADREDFVPLEGLLDKAEAALVRIDFMPGEAPEKMPATAQVTPLTGDAAPHEVELVGLAPDTDPQMQGVGYLALWRGGPPPPGTALRAMVASGAEPQKVMTVPRSALVRHEGGVFIFVQTGEGGFEARRVEVVRNLPDAVALAGGVAEGDKIVVTGAQQLLATQVLGAMGGAGDD